jgi:hypothetical protein
MLIRVYDASCAAVVMACLIGMIVLALFSMAGFDFEPHARRSEALDQFFPDCAASVQLNNAKPPGAEAVSVSGHLPPRPAAGLPGNCRGAAAAASCSDEGGAR